MSCLLLGLMATRLSSWMPTYTAGRGEASMMTLGLHDLFVALFPAQRRYRICRDKRQLAK